MFLRRPGEPEKGHETGVVEIERNVTQGIDRVKKGFYLRES
jgi:hypothetical protein